MLKKIIIWDTKSFFFPLYFILSVFFSSNKKNKFKNKLIHPIYIFKFEIIYIYISVIFNNNHGQEIFRCWTRILAKSLHFLFKHPTRTTPMFRYYFIYPHLRSGTFLNITYSRVERS